MTRPLLERLESGLRLTVDRGFVSCALWREAIGAGADLLWRVRTDGAAPKLVHLQDLPDGSWLAHLAQTHSAAARRAELMRVRVVGYTIDDGRQRLTGSTRPCSTLVRCRRPSSQLPTSNAETSS